MNTNESKTAFTSKTTTTLAHCQSDTCGNKVRAFVMYQLRLIDINYVHRLQYVMHLLLSGVYGHGVVEAVVCCRRRSHRSNPRAIAPPSACRRRRRRRRRRRWSFRRIISRGLGGANLLFIVLYRSQSKRHSGSVGATAAASAWLTHLFTLECF